MYSFSVFWPTCYGYSSLWLFLNFDFSTEVVCVLDVVWEAFKSIADKFVTKLDLKAPPFSRIYKALSAMSSSTCRLVFFFAISIYLACEVDLSSKILFVSILSAYCLSFYEKRGLIRVSFWKTTPLEWNYALDSLPWTAADIPIPGTLYLEPTC